MEAENVSLLVSYAVRSVELLLSQVKIKEVQNVRIVDVDVRDGLIAFIL